MNGEDGRDPLGNNRGIPPATRVSPAHSANEIPTLATKVGTAAGVKFRAAQSEIVLRRVPDDPLEEGDAKELEIDTMFRRRLSGLRRLPRRERPHALRAAKEWRILALMALREERARKRRAAWQLRRLQSAALG